MRKTHTAMETSSMQPQSMSIIWSDSSEDMNMATKVVLRDSSKQIRKLKGNQVTFVPEFDHSSSPPRVIARYPEQHLEPLYAHINDNTQWVTKYGKTMRDNCWMSRNMHYDSEAWIEALREATFNPQKMIPSPAEAFIEFTGRAPGIFQLRNRRWLKCESCKEKMSIQEWKQKGQHEMTTEWREWPKVIWSSFDDASEPYVAQFDVLRTGGNFAYCHDECKHKHKTTMIERFQKNIEESK